jgi:hypothetical protein
MSFLRTALPCRPASYRMIEQMSSGFAPELAPQLPVGLHSRSARPRLWRPPEQPSPEADSRKPHTAEADCRKRPNHARSVGRVALPLGPDNEHAECVLVGPRPHPKRNRHPPWQAWHGAAHEHRQRSDRGAIAAVAPASAHPACALPAKGIAVDPASATAYVPMRFAVRHGTHSSSPLPAVGGLGIC